MQLLFFIVQRKKKQIWAVVFSYISINNWNTRLYTCHPRGLLNLNGTPPLKTSPPLKISQPKNLASSLPCGFAIIVTSNGKNFCIKKKYFKVFVWHKDVQWVFTVFPTFICNNNNVYVGWFSPLASFLDCYSGHDTRCNFLERNSKAIELITFLSVVILKCSVIHSIQHNVGVGIHLANLCKNSYISNSWNHSGIKVTNMQTLVHSIVRLVFLSVLNGFKANQICAVVDHLINFITWIHVQTFFSSRYLPTLWANTIRRIFSPVVCDCKMDIWGHSSIQRCYGSKQ